MVESKFWSPCLTERDQIGEKYAENVGSDWGCGIKGRAYQVRSQLDCEVGRGRLYK